MSPDEVGAPAANYHPQQSKYAQWPDGSFWASPGHRGDHDEEEAGGKKIGYSLNQNRSPVFEDEVGFSD